MEIGVTIRSLRKKKGFSQDDMAKNCEVTQTTLSQIETGASNPSKSTMKKICKELGVPEYMVYMLSVDIEDVPKEKRYLFEQLYPVIKDLSIRLFDKDPKSKLEDIDL